MMSRLLELRALQKAPGSQDCWFRHFHGSLAANPRKHKRLTALEAVLRNLDDDAWAMLRDKAAPHFTKPPGQRGWQQAFDRLNEARAYNALVRDGWQPAFIAEDGREKRPDLLALSGRRTLLCEVKTVHVMERQGPSSIAGLTAKLSRAVTAAAAQIAGHPQARLAEKMAYLILDLHGQENDLVEAAMSRVEAWRAVHSGSELKAMFDIETTG